jgi:cephalosporin hydroxylase
LKPFEYPPVPHLQNEWEMKKIVELYQLRNPRKVLEIGSFYGATLWLWMNYSDNLERVVSVDWSIPPSDIRYNEMIEAKRKWPTWKNADKLIPIEGSSHSEEVVEKVKSLFPKRDVDFLMIDADHSYWAVKQDYTNYYSLVKPGGWVVFHDSFGIPSVKKFVDEIRGQHKFLEIYAGEGGWGYTIFEK